MSGQPNSPIEVKASDEIGYHRILGFPLINSCAIRQSLEMVETRSSRFPGIWIYSSKRRGHQAWSLLKVQMAKSAVDGMRKIPAFSKTEHEGQRQ